MSNTSHCFRIITQYWPSYRFCLYLAPSFRVNHGIMDCKMRRQKTRNITLVGAQRISFYGTIFAWITSVTNRRTELQYQQHVTTHSNEFTSYKHRLMNSAHTSKHFIDVRLKYFQFNMWTLAWNYFKRLLQLFNIFQHVHRRWNDSEIILELRQRLKWFYFIFRRGYMWNKTLKWFQNNFILHVTTA